MAKRNKHVLIDEPLAEAIDRYAEGHGISFTAALSVLAARGLQAEGDRNHGNAQAALPAES